MDKYPSDLSGGQKQRAVLARAIILGPDVLIADEPVSMLDMSVRAKILELMLELKDELDLTYLYITHDLATAKFFCDRIAIMYLGRIVEIGAAEQIYADPKHPYTVALLRGDPRARPRRAPCRATSPAARSPTRSRPPLGCRVPPALPAARSRSAAGRAATSAACSRPAGRSSTRPSTRREREIIGDLDGLDEPGAEAVVPAASGHSGADVAAILEQLRQQAPDDPFWRGVEEIETRESDVRVVFKERLVPRPLEVGAALVECHLHDSEALATADRLSTTPR